MLLDLIMHIIIHDVNKCYHGCIKCGWNNLCFIWCCTPLVDYVVLQLLLIKKVFFTCVSSGYRYMAISPPYYASLLTWVFVTSFLSQSSHVHPIFSFFEICKCCIINESRRLPLSISKEVITTLSTFDKVTLTLSKPNGIIKASFIQEFFSCCVLKVVSKAFINGI